MDVLQATLVEVERLCPFVLEREWPGDDVDTDGGETMVDPGEYIRVKVPRRLRIVKWMMVA